MKSLGSKPADLAELERRMWDMVLSVMKGHPVEEQLAACIEDLRNMVVEGSTGLEWFGLCMENETSGPVGGGGRVEGVSDGVEENVNRSEKDELGEVAGLLTLGGVEVNECHHDYAMEVDNHRLGIAEEEASIAGEAEVEASRLSLPEVGTHATGAPEIETSLVEEGASATGAPEMETSLPEEGTSTPKEIDERHADQGGDKMCGGMGEDGSGEDMEISEDERDRVAENEVQGIVDNQRANPPAPSKFSLGSRQATRPPAKPMPVLKKRKPKRRVAKAGEPSCIHVVIDLTGEVSKLEMF